VLPMGHNSANSALFMQIAVKKFVSERKSYILDCIVLIRTY